MGQDETDTDNKGTDDNDNDDDGDQGMKTDDEEDNHHRSTTGMGMGTGTDDMTRQKWQRHTTRGTTRTGEERKAQAMDPALYDEECKKRPKRRRRLLGCR